MKRLWIVAALLLVITSCAKAPIDEYIGQEHVVMNAYSDLGITPEMKDRLSRAFREQVDWGEEGYDGKAAQMALSAMDAELSWIDKEVNRNGYMNFYAASGSYERLQYWSGILFVVLDKVSKDGAVDSDTSLIYFFVRKSVKSNLAILNVVLDKSRASLTSRANAFTLNQFKEIAENMMPLISGIL